ncbi:hypothetical protein LTR17_001391 [Elasticomyces elasticus]|nr:hypothetical protein LTR17_001391 [Elasticomyces elasticus]
MVGFVRTVHHFVHRPGGPLPEMLADLEDFDRDFLQSDYHQPRPLAFARRIIPNATLGQKYDVTHWL